eukprot:152273_1
MAEEKKLTPHFEWCQDMDRILLRIELNNVKVDETKLDITRDTFSFSYKSYVLKFSFRFPVNPNTVKYKTSRLLDLVIEKETSNAYWPHLLPKPDKKRLKNQCKVDWNRFMDEDEAKKRQKGVVDDDDAYGNLGMMGGDNESSSDDSDDQPIDDLEQNKPSRDDAKQNKKKKRMMMMTRCHHYNLKKYHQKTNQKTKKMLKKRRIHC